MSYKVVHPLFALFLLFGQLSPKASSPVNDPFANAAVIASFPFSTTVDVSAATSEPNEPQYCNFMDRTVWYTFRPTATMHLRAYAQDGSGAAVNIYQAAGAGIAGLQHIECASPDSPVSFTAEAGETYYLQVGSPGGQPGVIEFGLSEITTISGRVTNANTGAPLAGDAPPFSLVTLYRECGDGCWEAVISTGPDGEGRFVFDSYFGDPLPGGTYQIEASASMYQTQTFGPFAFDGTSLDAGDLPLEPVASIGSIRGRLLDLATVQPVSPVFEPVVYLFHCTEVECTEAVNSQVPDSQGRFLFETDSAGSPLPVGTYQIQVVADQYQHLQTKRFEVAAGAHRTVGPLRVRSFSVRFSEITPCADLPAVGGECAFRARVWNGLPARLAGSAWSLVSSALPDSQVGFSEFQVKELQPLELERGKSKVVRFRFIVPESHSPTNTSVCARLFVGRGGNAILNTIGFKELFCLTRSAGGFATAARPDVAADKQPAVGAALELEPNNSCQAPQEFGALAYPFLLGGNLESSSTPDIDFFRFRGTPGAPLILNYEGQATGKGTLFDPQLGVFDSNCKLYASNDDGFTLNSRLAMTVPEDGVFIVAATAYPDDHFIGGGNGTYQLKITQLKPIGSIRGNVADALTALPLSGGGLPYAYVHLLQCSAFGCIKVSQQSPAKDGSFSFDRDANGVPLGAGTYAVYVQADQYQGKQTAQFKVAAGVSYSTGTIALTPFPIHFSNATPCAVLPEGGVCEFSVQVANGLATPLSGKAWAMISGSQIGSYIGFTDFQSDAPLSVKLDPGKNSTLNFRFRVRGAVADGAVLCATVYMGQNPGAYFSTVGQSLLFCFVKGDSGLALLSAQDAQSAAKEIQQAEAIPRPFFHKKEK